MEHIADTFFKGKEEDWEDKKEKEDSSLNNLLSEFDCRKWSKEFVKLFGNEQIDEELMISWFACALMSGYDAGRSDDFHASLEACQSGYDSGYNSGYVSGYTEGYISGVYNEIIIKQSKQNLTQNDALNQIQNDGNLGVDLKSSCDTLHDYNI